MMKGVITADIVGSTRIPIDRRGDLPRLISEIADDLQCVSSLKVEMYRGDSFQILVDDAWATMKVAVLFRARLKMSDLKENGKGVDARMAIGIGDVTYMDDKLALSDGSAFMFSGREFDALKKRRLAVITANDDVNSELRVSSAFLDDVITHWTGLQSEYVYQYLMTGATQEKLAKKIKTSRQNVGSKLASAKVSLVELYLDRVKKIISKM